MFTRGFFIIVIAGVLTGLSACAQTAELQSKRMVGSTPGDSFMKAMLSIPNETLIDFIKWDLQLTAGAKKDKGDFTLNINYGEGKPNTTGFIGGGEKKTYKGTYTYFGKLCALQSTEFYERVTLLQLNENLMHVTETDLSLKKGNSGWSYTLNRATPLVSQTDLSATRNYEMLLGDTATRMVFEGRTPCQPVAKDFSLPVDKDCFKLKWQLVLNRNSVTLEPMGYTIRRTDSRVKDIVGDWKFIKTSDGKESTIVIQLDPDRPDQSMNFLAGDNNILFMLDKNRKIYTGNDLFSYTLNRVKK